MYLANGKGIQNQVNPSPTFYQKSQERSEDQDEAEVEETSILQAEKIPGVIGTFYSQLETKETL